MGKRKKGKKAYLKHHSHRYDPNSQYALRTRGARAIDLGSVPPPTITHGKRGLTIARAKGPTAVIKDAYTDDVENQAMRGATKSTMVPRAQVGVQYEAMVAFEQTPFYQKFRHYHSRVVLDRPGSKITMWFSGREFIFVKQFNNKEFRSTIYSSEEALRCELRPSKIIWVEELKVPSG